MGADSIARGGAACRAEDVGRGHDKYGVDELTFNDYFRLTRAGKVTVIAKRKLYRDHLELSTLFRGWLCNFCNIHKIPLLDARTTAEYKLYQGRLYVNCTTFPSA